MSHPYFDLQHTLLYIRQFVNKKGLPFNCNIINCVLSLHHMKDALVRNAAWCQTQAKHTNSIRSVREQNHVEHQYLAPPVKNLFFDQRFNMRYLERSMNVTMFLGEFIMDVTTCPNFAIQYSPLEAKSAYYM